MKAFPSHRINLCNRCDYVKPGLGCMQTELLSYAKWYEVKSKCRHEGVRKESNDENW